LAVGQVDVDREGLSPIPHYIKESIKIDGVNAWVVSTNDWKAILFETFGLTQQHIVVYRIMNDPRLQGEARIRAFEAATGMSRATYFRLQNELKGLRDGAPLARRRPA
jgi:hypothetical protein